MELERAFKLSEAGPIPEDWEALTLGDVCERIGDGTHFTPTYVENGVPFYSVENVSAYNFQVCKYISESAHQLMAKRLRPTHGDILMTRIGSIGETALVAWSHEFNIYVSLALLRPRSVFDRVYVYHATKRPEFLRAVLDRSLTHAIPQKINLDAIPSVPLAIPPAAEQRAIAQALNDLDAWIASAEAEAAKLASVKAAVMGALLTPTTRLPGFTGEWGRVRIGDLYDPLSTVAVARAAYVHGGGVACIHYGDIHVRYDGFVRIGCDHVATVPASLVRSAARLNSGDVLIADAAEDLDGVGKAVELIATQGFQMVGGLHVQALRPRPDKVALGFAGYLFRQRAYRDAVERAASGLKVYGISKSQLATLEVLLPPTLAEQQAITAVLSDMDAALDAARAAVAKARGVKAAAMDALLSGRVRLPPFGPPQHRTTANALEAA